jgi:mannobiose 2-epimerase
VVPSRFVTVAPANDAVPLAADTLRAAETCWPLARSPEFSLLDADWRDSRAVKLESDLREHVMEPWYPRCIDTESGGFFCDFDWRWRPRGPQTRMLEFQARQTRSSARLGVAFPGDGRWAEHTRHGLRYLDEVMRDGEYGGWYWLVDRSGTAQAGGTKHAHSTAYLIGTYVEAYRLTADKATLESAKAAFEWLDLTLHDAEHGGYRTWATREGRPILTHADGALPDDAHDPLGHRVGAKDANVHSDLLDALRLLYEEWPTEMLRERLSELYEIVLRRHGMPDGSMHYLLTDELQPDPSPERYGYPLQSGARMMRIAPLIGASVAKTQAWARTGLDHVLSDGRAADGAFAETPVNRARQWWVQGEAMQLLLTIAANVSDNERYVRAYDELMSSIDDQFIDPINKGWHPIARGDWRLRARLGLRHEPKAHRWKDASHETDAYLTGIRILRGLPGSGALS